MAEGYILVKDKAAARLKIVLLPAECVTFKDAHCDSRCKSWIPKAYPFSREDSVW